MNARARILDAGVDLLQTQGIAALTQPRVAKAAGLTQSHLTYYFPTRNALLLAIAEAAIEHVLAELGRAGAAPPAALGDQLGQLIPQQAPVRVMLGLIVAADSEPALRASLEAMILRIRQGVTALLERRGLAATPPQVLLVHAAVVGLSVMHHARQSEASAADIAAGTHELMRLLTADGAQRPAS